MSTFGRQSHEGITNLLLCHLLILGTGNKNEAVIPVTIGKGCCSFIPDWRNCNVVLVLLPRNDEKHIPIEKCT